MNILGKLYASAETHLGGDVRDWVAFANEFKAAFSAHMALYHTSFEADQRTIKLFDFICTSDPPAIEKYIEAKVYLYHPIPETELSPLEPARRTDDVSDTDFRKLGPLADFLIENGMFYQMVVPALLSDGSYSALAVWRDEKQGDFSDIEKQRFALFMRHLVAIVDETDLVLENPATSVTSFGQKWRLTKTETVILSALLQGLSLHEISKQTDRSYGTVRWHVQNILEKCQVSSQKTLLAEFYQLVA